MLSKMRTTKMSASISATYHIRKVELLFLRLSNKKTYSTTRTGQFFYTSSLGIYTFAFVSCSL